MKINEIVNPHTPADRTLDSIAGVDTNKVATTYQLVLIVSEKFLMSSYDAMPPDQLSDLRESIEEMASGAIPGTTSYKMIQEIQQWLNGE